jgi:Fic family protein
MGKMQSLGFELQNEALLDTLVLDVIKSSEIEGENLPPDQVRSSLPRKLGLAIASSEDSDRDVDGMIELMIDATKNCFSPLIKDSLFDWHAALFPTGRNGMHKITIAEWRKNTSGPM